MWFDDLPTLLLVASALTLPALLAGKHWLAVATLAAPAKTLAIAAAPSATRATALTPGDAYGRIVRYIEANGASVLEVQKANWAAARQIDSAEVALNLLIADIASVMPGRFAPTVQPLRALTALH